MMKGSLARARVIVIVLLGLAICAILAQVDSSEASVTRAPTAATMVNAMTV